jgi:solute carrier family 25 phosphate transporter 3
MAPQAMIPAAPKKKIEMYSNEYFMYCAYGGILSCGLTHTAMTPVDLVKCNMQANPKEFTGLLSGLRKIHGQAGLRGLTTGWVPTLYGYSVQGFFKFGLYEFFKYKFYKAISNQYSPEIAHTYRDLVYLSASASAEFFADIGLCAFEATKVRMQTTLDPVTLRPTFANSMLVGMGKITSAEGLSGLFKGVSPLWFRQIPYTMMKFFGFERAVELIYSQLSKPKDQYNKLQQLGVSFAGGYLAGIFCATVSHPADTVVSIVNKKKGTTIGQVFRETPKMDLLTKGLGARIIMIGTLTGLQWLIYDSFKTSVGLSTTGGAPPPPKAGASSHDKKPHAK